MSAKRIVLLIGIILAIAGAAWWAVYYSGAADRLLQPRMDFLGEVLPCMVYLTDFCEGLSTVAGLFGFSTYHPVLIWAAAVLLIVGLILPSRRGSA
ncbi:MAG: hypothetical protein AB7O56_13630 [Bauldia sp.]